MKYDGNCFPIDGTKMTYRDGILSADISDFGGNPAWGNSLYTNTAKASDGSLLLDIYGKSGATVTFVQSNTIRDREGDVLAFEFRPASPADVQKANGVFKAVFYND